jgi:hypothetical protein
VHTLQLPHPDLGKHLVGPQPVQLRLIEPDALVPHLHQQLHRLQRWVLGAEGGEGVRLVGGGGGAVGCLRLCLLLRLTV